MPKTSEQIINKLAGWMVGKETSQDGRHCTFCPLQSDIYGERCPYDDEWPTYKQCISAVKKWAGWRNTDEPVQA